MAKAMDNIFGCKKIRHIAYCHDVYKVHLKNFCAMIFNIFIYLNFVT